jgi:hypothetical protein
MKKRRDFVFDELFRLVCEYDHAVSSSGIENGWDVDGALGAILIRLNGETRRIRKIQSAEKLDAVCAAA